MELKNIRHAAGNIHVSMFQVGSCRYLSIIAYLGTVRGLLSSRSLTLFRHLHIPRYTYTYVNILGSQSLLLHNPLYSGGFCLIIRLLCFAPYTPPLSIFTAPFSSRLMTRLMMAKLFLPFSLTPLPLPFSHAFLEIRFKGWKTNEMKEKKN